MAVLDPSHAPRSKLYREEAWIELHARLEKHAAPAADLLAALFEVETRRARSWEGLRARLAERRASRKEAISTEPLPEESAGDTASRTRLVNDDIPLVWESERDLRTRLAAIFDRTLAVLADEQADRPLGKIHASWAAARAAEIPDAAALSRVFGDHFRRLYQPRAHQATEVLREGFEELAAREMRLGRRIARLVEREPGAGGFYTTPQVTDGEVWWRRLVRRLRERYTERGRNERCLSRLQLHPRPPAAAAPGIRAWKELCDRDAGAINAATDRIEGQHELVSVSARASLDAHDDARATCASVRLMVPADANDDVDGIMKEQKKMRADLADQQVRNEAVRISAQGLHERHKELANELAQLERHVRRLLRSRGAGDLHTESVSGETSS